MKLRDIYAQDGLTISIEFFPPKTPKGDADLFREVEILPEGAPLPEDGGAPPLPTVTFA